MSGRLIFTKQRYTHSLLRANARFFFLFGDNALRVGNGGQAVIRAEPNALGIATKRSPSEYMQAGSIDDMQIILNDLRGAETMLRMGQVLIMPVLDSNHTPSLGCGLAELPQRAPDLYAFICAWSTAMRQRYA